ncbi:hypothetical protein B0H14DRAFT_2565882 [Mycena olivaceomarginata]|nr:hypothetical protein B0H14DRAFT_2565882 [Mycena olivaceomarginata]
MDVTSRLDAVRHGLRLGASEASRNAAVYHYLEVTCSAKLDQCDQTSSSSYSHKSNLKLLEVTYKLLLLTLLYLSATSKVNFVRLIQPRTHLIAAALATQMMPAGACGVPKAVISRWQGCAKGSIISGRQGCTRDCVIGGQWVVPKAVLLASAGGGGAPEAVSSVGGGGAPRAASSVGSSTGPFIIRQPKIVLSTLYHWPMGCGFLMLYSVPESMGGSFEEEAAALEEPICDLCSGLEGPAGAVDIVMVK